GLMDSRPEDWVFVDWAELDNSGQVCYEQLLMIAALRACANLGKQFGQKERAGKYGKIYEESLKLIEKFWCEEKGAYVYSYKNGVPDGKILRQPNVMAVFYDLCDDERKEKIKNNVLKNDAVTPITTPYMRFYELSALCKLGETEYVLQELYGYWGGMLEDGATTFWESYDKRQKEPEKYAMYGRKYGKSLCHAWGAGPLYIIGRYIVGLKPENGESFTIEPNVSVLKNFRATFHLPKGNISVEVCGGKIGILSETLCGKLILNGITYDVEAGKFTEAGV
ncbi:MAG: alpha-rhamnosidase, partial [Clostridia bacterium]|nr:alpha-rhamnosidase [Clostridia bacterium]